ncbi:MAG: NUDIX domain-containing protein [Rickettsiales bacterium]|jgi:isopentenyldiphosphate isomerase|nr:NUDIX domain-containing protein [Rickettsiales bacterium]
MTEFLDVYDANKKHIGTADRNVVHAFGLWHKTVHCWIVWRGQLLFQRRARKLDNNPGKLYTTASGHVSAGETLDAAFRHEVMEEIGLSLDNPKLGAPTHLYETVWVADMKKTNGEIMRDRVFCNNYFAEYSGELTDFKFTDGEVDGVVAIPLEQFITLSHGDGAPVPATEFDGQNIIEFTVTETDFILNPGENIHTKYGRIAETIRQRLKK